MSIRSMVEINHDLAAFDDPNWVRKFAQYIRSGNPRDLPDGVTYFDLRHHSTPCALGEPPQGWDNRGPKKGDVG